MDLCLNCIGKSVERKSDPPKRHTVDHHLLQFRTVRHRRTLYAKQRQALNYLDSIEGPADDSREQTLGLTCHLCHKAFDRPAWHCLDCKGASSLSVCVIQC
jgi:hypothetical protein